MELMKVPVRVSVRGPQREIWREKKIGYTLDGVSSADAHFQCYGGLSTFVGIVVKINGANT